MSSPYQRPRRRASARPSPLTATHERPFRSRERRGAWRVGRGEGRRKADPLVRRTSMARKWLIGFMTVAAAAGAVWLGVTRGATAVAAAGAPKVYVGLFKDD